MPHHICVHLTCNAGHMVSYVPGEQRNVSAGAQPGRKNLWQPGNSTASSVITDASSQSLPASAAWTGIGVKHRPDDCRSVIWYSRMLQHSELHISMIIMSTVVRFDEVFAYELLYQH